MSKCKRETNWADLLFQWHSLKEFYILDILDTPVVEQGRLMLI